MPVKLYHYLAFGRPLLVIDCVEQARVVSDTDARLVMRDAPDAMAGAILTLVNAPRERLSTWSGNARAAASASSWGVRAPRFVEIRAAGA